MVDKEKIARLITEIEEYLLQIAELQKIERKIFLTDWRIYDLVDRKLHLVLETFLSIGEIIISEFKLKKPDTYADIPQILSQNKIISKKTGERLIDLAKFRNVLVHGYLSLDHKRVYEHLQKDPLLLKEFLKQIKKFIMGKS